MKWLQDNPVREVDCKAFLFAEVKKLRDILLRLQEQATESAPTRTSKWQGTVPYLRITTCLTKDHVKHLFLNRANARTPKEIDGRNSESRYVSWLAAFCATPNDHVTNLLISSSTGL